MNFQELKFNLYSAVISDTLDGMGYLDQALSSGIRPLDDGMVLCGLARVGIYMKIYHDDEKVNVYEHEIALIDSLQPNEVAVLLCHQHHEIAPWGELLSTRSQFLKAAGCLTDGSVRDVKRIRQMSFPVFAGNIGPLDSKHRGKLMWYDIPGKIHGVDVNSGDFVFGDVDGVVIVPQHITTEVVEKALKKVREENQVRGLLENGVSLAKAFEEHGIL
jgi:regulator of RNase E activity RraA